MDAEELKLFRRDPGVYEYVKDLWLPGKIPGTDKVRENDYFIAAF